jgi:hypothetical protein
MNCVHFAATVRTWAPALGDGLRIYALNNSLAIDLIELFLEVTSAIVCVPRCERTHFCVVVMAFRLGEKQLVCATPELLPRLRCRVRWRTEIQV